MRNAQFIADLVNAGVNAAPLSCQQYLPLEADDFRGAAHREWSGANYSPLAFIPVPVRTTGAG